MVQRVNFLQAANVSGCGCVCCKERAYWFQAVCSSWVVMPSQNVVRTCVMERSSRGVGVGVGIDVGVDMGEGVGDRGGTGDGAVLPVLCGAASGRCSATATPLISRKVASHPHRIVSVSRRYCCSEACTSWVS